MAQPIKGTKQADLTLNGTNGDDTIQGKDGNDTITGGKGNDSIDGGNGIDTAVYSGSIAEYNISFKGTGNEKVTVSDTVAGRDGTDQLKHVEFLNFADGVVNVENGAEWHYLVNAVLDSAAQDPSAPGTMFVGTGIPADHFGIARNEDAGVELALKVHHRSTGADPTYLTSDDYSDGVLHFQVEDGPAVAGGAPKAEWSFDFSIATGLNGATTDLGDFTFQLLYDVDPGTGTRLVIGP